MTTSKTDFFITYHHDDDMAARWIAAMLKQARFSTLSDSWDFLPGETSPGKIGYMLTAARNAMVLVSGNFLRLQVDSTRSFGKSRNPFSKGFLVAEGKVIIIRIEACEIEKVMGEGEYVDLSGIAAKEAEKRLLAAVGGAVPKEPVPLPVSAVTREELLALRKQEMDQLLAITIKHNYLMKLDMEHEVEKEVEVKNEKTGEMEKRKECVWEPVPLETLLRDKNNYILVNPSGMGKTTFLTFAAYALLDREANYSYLPLLFTCIGLNNRAGTIEDFISRQVESLYTGTQGSLVSGDWKNLCILIDALDQARDVDDIVSSLLLLDKPLHYKKAKIILSSRQNTADKVKEGFAKIRLKLPEAEEVRLYLGEENYQKLEGIIEASGELVKVPVLLEMLKTITEKGHVVSSLFNRADLYTEFTKVLLEQERSKPRYWQDKLSIRHFIDYELEQALEKIAFFSLAENEILEIPKEKLAQYCESQEKKEALFNIGILLELFEDREQKIVFRHQSFQAYFVARYINNQQPEIFQELVGDITFFYSDVWYEVMRFFVGLEKNPQKKEDIIDGIYQTDEKNNDLNYTFKFRLIFTVFLMSEAWVSCEFVQRLYKQLRDLLNNNKQYLDFFNSNTDKFNKANEEQRRNVFFIFDLLLRDESSHARSTAAEALGKIGTAKDIHLIEPLLRDKSKDVRSATAEALGKIGNTEHIPFLEPLLWDTNQKVLDAAVTAICKVITAKDIPLLVSLFSDKHWSVRYSAVSALRDICASEHIPLLESLLHSRPDETIVWVHPDVNKALEKIGSAKDIPLLKSILSDENSHVRIAVAKLLGEIGNSEHIPLLVSLLEDVDGFVRSSAVEAIGRIGDTEHVLLLEPLIKDKYVVVRKNVASTLGNIGTSDHIPLLKSLLKDEESYVREAAFKTLGEIGTAEDIPFLTLLLKNEAKNTTYNFETTIDIATETFVKISTAKDIPLLELLLKDDNKYVRRAAVKALGKIVSADHIPLLEPLLRDNDHRVRSAAVKALANIGTRDIFFILIPMLRVGDSSVSDVAAEVFKKIGTARDIHFLEPLLRDEFFYVRHTAAEVLGTIGTLEHISLIEPLLRDKDDWVRRTTVEAIEKIYKRSTPKLRLNRILPKKKEEKVLPVKLFSGQTLHILHISDIHYAKKNDPTITPIFHEFLKDIKKWRTQQNHRNIQTICLTGDIAASGKKDEYEAIHEKINAILETTGCAREDLFIIPGNHDVQEFDKMCDQGRTLLEQARENKINVDTGVLSSAENYRLFHEKFANYYRFIAKNGYLSSLPENRHPIPGLANPWYNHKLKEYPVRIMGLNSALFCLKGFSKYGDLHMGTHQFQEAYFQGKAGDSREPEVVILLTHHPLNWLAESEYNEYSTLMERYAVLHLHGHIHKTHIEKKQRLFSSSGGYVSIGTGSLYGEKGKADINTYHIITLDFESQEVHVWARRWNPETGKWTVYDDDGNNRFRLPVKDGS